MNDKEQAKFNKEGRNSLQQLNSQPLANNKTTGWGPISAILVTFGIYFGTQVLAISGFLIYYDLKKVDDETLEKILENSINVQFLYLFSIGVLSLLFLWWFLKSRSIKFSDVGLNKPRIDRLFMALPAFGIYFASFIVLAVISKALIPDVVDFDQKQQIGFEGAAGASSLAIVFVSLVILPAIVEEIMIRGFLYGGLIKKFTKIASALIASVIFGVAHLQLGSGASPLWVAAVDTFILSMVLIWLREQTGSIWAGMIVHGMKNSLAFVILFITSK